MVATKNKTFIKWSLFLYFADTSSERKFIYLKKRGDTQSDYCFFNDLKKTRHRNFALSKQWYVIFFINISEENVNNFWWKQSFSTKDDNCEKVLFRPPAPPLKTWKMMKDPLVSSKRNLLFNITLRKRNLLFFCLFSSLYYYFSFCGSLSIPLFISSPLFL
jgi:hypothetical protein